MVDHKEDNAPFIRFLDVVGRERHHDYRYMGFFCERGLVIHTLDEEFSFYAHLMELGLKPLTECGSSTPSFPQCGSMTLILIREFKLP